MPPHKINSSVKKRLRRAVVEKTPPAWVWPCPAGAREPGWQHGQAQAAGHRGMEALAGASRAAAGLEWALSRARGIFPRAFLLTWQSPRCPNPQQRANKGHGAFPGLSSEPFAITAGDTEGSTAGQRQCPRREGRGCTALISLSATLQGTQCHSGPAFQMQFALPVVVLPLFTACLYWLSPQSRLQLNQREGRGAADFGSHPHSISSPREEESSSRQRRKWVGPFFSFFFSPLLFFDFSSFPKKK